MHCHTGKKKTTLMEFRCAAALSSCRYSDPYWFLIRRPVTDKKINQSCDVHLLLGCETVSQTVSSLSICRSCFYYRLAVCRDANPAANISFLSGPVPQTLS